VVPDDFVQVVLCILKREAQARLGAVDVHRVERDDVFVAKLTQQQDLPHSGGGDAVTLLWCA
jgi:hypothetical protein